MAFGFIKKLLGFNYGFSTTGITGPNLYSLPLLSIDGEPLKTELIYGHVVLIVNTASLCGFTSQYAGLEELYQKYNERGLCVIGAPSNSFGGQEPGDSHAIQSFCSLNYGVSFPLLQKSAAKGSDMSPLFQYLSKEANPKFKGAIKWNFEKFLFDRKGALRGRFSSLTTPSSGRLVQPIEELLGN